MEQRAWIATRKGLFEMHRRQGAWTVERIHFLGEPVSMVLPPQASGRMLAALHLGHFGAKVQASDDGGANWHELPAPAYPPQPEGEPVAGVAWTLQQIWSLEAARGTVWAGTLPGGLFRSDDDAESWQLVEPLWNQPGRAEWFGGGFDVPGIHSICPHPTRAGELLVGISCGGAWVTRDDAASWQLQADGMHAAYMPPDQAESPNTQDPHRIVRCAAQPDVLWCQHHNGIWRSTDNAASWLRGGRTPDPCRHRVVRARRGRPAARTGRRRTGREPHARRRPQLRDLAHRPAARELLRPGLPSWPGRGRDRAPPVDGQHDRRFVGERRWRRPLVDGGRPPATDLRGAVRLSRDTALW
jgi:hypothetical protein